jgi:hypothetical protein
VLIGGNVFGIDDLAFLLTVTGSLVSILPKLIQRWRLGKSGFKLEYNRGQRQRREIEIEREIVGRGVTLQPRPSRPPKDEPSSAAPVLFVFAAIVVLFSAVALWRYWPQIQALGDYLFLGGGLLLMMIAGMFVQVLTSNYAENKSLFQVSPSRLLYPLLFSPIVFYPIWLVGDKEGARLFSFYAAFLNGYFWQSVVAAAKRPEPPGME